VAEWHVPALVSKETKKAMVIWAFFSSHITAFYGI
jgi:hypothetical protein